MAVDSCPGESVPALFQTGVDRVDQSVLRIYLYVSSEIVSLRPFSTPSHALLIVLMPIVRLPSKLYSLCDEFFGFTDPP